MLSRLITKIKLWFYCWTLNRVYGVGIELHVTNGHTGIKLTGDPEKIKAMLVVFENNLVDAGAFANGNKVKIEATYGKPKH